MRKRFIATFVCSALSLIGASGFALAETIGRYECSFIGTGSQEPIGGTGHSLSSNQFSCFGVDGLLKGAVYTGSSIGEWGGSPRNVFLYRRKSTERLALLRLRNSRKAPVPYHERRQSCRLRKTLEKRSSSLLRAHWPHSQER